MCTCGYSANSRLEEAVCDGVGRSTALLVTSELITGNEWAGLLSSKAMPRPEPEMHQGCLH